MADRRVVGGLLILAYSQARADTVLLPASRDNTLFQNALGQLSNGAGPAFFAGVNNGDNHRRGLLRFDVDAIPAGSTVTAVSLTLHLSRSNAEGSIISIHRCLQDWGESASNSGDPGGGGAPAAHGDATWLHTFYATQFWGAPGGAPGIDFVADSSAESIVGTEVAFYTWASTTALIADVQAWVNGPSANFGWFIIGDETTVGTAKRFDSREAEDPSFHPVLAVTFIPPCYANCDGSTSNPVLTANDFQCFLNRFATQSTSANCDGSTANPVLTANDFQCFLNKYAIGCG